jgi:hypothetical protein
MSTFQTETDVPVQSGTDVPVWSTDWYHAGVAETARLSSACSQLSFPRCLARRCYGRCALRTVEDLDSGEPRTPGKQLDAGWLTGRLLRETYPVFADVRPRTDCTITAVAG